MTTMMVVPERFHLINDSLCFVLGYLANLTLMWLVLRHTTINMRPYSPILLLSTLIDLVYLGVYVVVQPLMSIDAGRGIMISLGPLGWVPQPFNFALIAAWMYLFTFSVYSLWVPFFYRYMILCRGKKHYQGWRVFLSLLTIPATLCCGHIAVLAYSGYTHTEEEQQVGRDFFFGSNSSSAAVANNNGSQHGALPSLSSPSRRYVIPIFIDDSPRHIAIAAYALVNIVASYLLSFFLGWRMYRHLRREIMSNLSAKHALELHKQVIIALLLQALTPFVVEFAPAMEMALTGLLGIEQGSLAPYKTGIFAWICVTNPLIAMRVMSTYRHVVLDWFSCGEWAGGGAQIGPMS